MAEAAKKKVARYVWQALIESAEVSADVVGGRKLTVVSSTSGDMGQHFLSAAKKAVANLKDGETLVSLSKQNDAVV